MKRALFRFGLGIVVVLAVFVSLAVALKILDIYLGSASPPLPGHDMALAHNTLRTLDLFPYTGWHIQANFHHDRGPMPPWDQPTMNFDVRSGPMGFFVDMDLQDPPAKQANEFRIILTGASGAQGFGATTNSKMMYKILEGLLNSQLSPRTGSVYRIFNLAMGSSLTYQNFVALNRWGHQLQPDLILSYSGVNDFTVPLFHEGMTDAFYQFNQLNALVLAARGSERPPGLRWAFWLFPNIMTRTNVGYATKVVFYFDDYRARARTDYLKARGLEVRDPKEFMRRTVVPMYVDALKSIKRDFDGIPIMVVWQAISDGEMVLFEKALGVGFYNRIFDGVVSEVDNYRNARWHFANFHEAARTLDPRCNTINGCIAVHPNDEGQRVLAEYILGQLRGFLKAREPPGRGAGRR
jgi:hypothetical protein